MEFDLGAAIGAEEGYSGQRLTLYIPNKDKDGNDVVDIEEWISEARKLLSGIGRGSTTFPPADGSWVKDNGEVLWEQTRVVYCYVYPDKLVENASFLREFLHRFGQKTNQGEVVVEFDGRFWRIRKYDV